MPSLSRLDKLVILESEAQGITLTELWNHYKNTKGTLRKTLQESYLEFLDEKGQAGRRKTYLHQLEWAVGEFVVACGQDRLVCDLGLGDVRKFVGAGNAQTRATRVSRLRTFLAWCKRQGYTNEVLTDRLETVSKEMGEPGVIGNADMAKLLEVSRLMDPEMLEYLWLCGALGIRKAEAMQLPAGCLRENGAFVEVGAAIAKTRSRRLVRCVVSSPLKSAEQIETGWQKNFRRRFDAIRLAAGIKEWPKNALRHTASSHLVNYLSDENKAALHLGNSPEMIHRHYRGLVTPRQSEEFWALWS